MRKRVGMRGVHALALERDGDSTTQSWGYVKPVAGTTAGVAGVHASCVAAGVGATQNQLNTVGPCTSTSGQSVF